MYVCVYTLWGHKSVDTLTLGGTRLPFSGTAHTNPHNVNDYILGLRFCVTVKGNSWSYAQATRAVTLLLRRCYSKPHLSTWSLALVKINSGDDVIFLIQRERKGDALEKQCPGDLDFWTISVFGCVSSFIHFSFL